MSRFSVAFVIVVVASFTGGLTQSATAEPQGQINYILVWANPDGTNRCSPHACWPACATGECSCCP
jgi:hypothetical protein